jgi:nitrate reductase NapE component
MNALFITMNEEQYFKTFWEFSIYLKIILSFGVIGAFGIIFLFIFHALQPKVTNYNILPESIDNENR